MMKIESIVRVAHIKHFVCLILIVCVCCMTFLPVHATSSDDTRVDSISIYDDNGGNTGRTVLIGESVNLRSSIYPTNATNRNIIWTTSNSSVAKVSNGVVTTYKKGNAVITATTVDGNFKASYPVTVVDENATYEYNGITYDYVWEKGTWGNNIKWYHCVGNKLIITGSGDMKEPSHPIEIPWGHIDPLSVEIQEGITSLCGSALEGLANATVLKLPSTIKRTGQNAFYVFGKQLNVNGVTYFGGTTYYGGTPDQYNEIDFGYHPFGGLPYNIEYCRASGHIESISEPVAATCRSYGKTIGVHCTQCEKEIVKSVQVDYIDCIYEDGYCTMCGIADPTVYVTSVNIQVDSYVLRLNESINISATVNPENATNQKIIWTSSNSEIATISDSGKVTGKLLGRVTITATSEDGGKADTCIVTIVEPIVSVTGITLNKSSTTMKVGATETLTAIVSPSDATNKNVSWSSSNPSVATVSNGVVTAKAVGTTIITATTADGDKTASCQVTVEEANIPYEVYVYTEAKKTVTQGSQFTFKVYLAGTYDGYSFAVIPPSGLSITDISASNTGIYVDEQADRWLVSVLGGLGKSEAEKEEVVTVTLQVDSEAQLGTRELSLSNVMISNDSGDKVSAVKYEYASIEITDQIPGDINGDGGFDYYDVSKLFAFYRGKATLDGAIDTDINGDGTFDYYDVSKLFAIYRGKATFN